MKNKKSIFIIIIIIIQIAMLFPSKHNSFMWEISRNFRNLMYHISSGEISFSSIYSEVLSNSILVMCALTIMQFAFFKKPKIILILGIILLAIFLRKYYSLIKGIFILGYKELLFTSAHWLLPLTYIAMYFALKLPKKPSRIELLEEEVARLKGEK